MTDYNYRDLCAELVSIADALDGGTPLISNQGQALDGYSALAEFRNVADRARAALAEPVAEPPAVTEQPSDEELERTYQSAYQPAWERGEFYGAHRDGLRAVLTRWGNLKVGLTGSPAEGEVAELVAWLRDKGRGAWPPPDGLSPSAQAEEYEFYSCCTRAAELLERHAAPIPDDVKKLVAAVQTANSAYGWVDQKQFLRLLGEAHRLADVIEEGCDCSIGGPINYQEVINALLNQIKELQTSAPVPVPVSERLPGPEDCDAEGQCWTTDYDPSLVYSPVWKMTELPRQELGQDFSNAYFWRSVTYWLPADALPLPTPNLTTEYQ